MVSKLIKDSPKAKVSPSSPAPRSAPSKPPAAKARPQVADEHSQGHGTALKRHALKTSGGAIAVRQLESAAPTFSLRTLHTFQKAPTASSLRTEVLGDGQANCLERAVAVARPGDRVVLLTDRRDPVGHAVVQRRDGTVVDPNAPSTPYATLESFTRANPRYGNPVAIAERDAREVLRTPPGPARNAVITRLGLDGAAARVVADPPALNERTTAAAQAAQLEAGYQGILASTHDPLQAARFTASQLQLLTQTNPAGAAALLRAAEPTLAHLSQTIGQAARGELPLDDDGRDRLRETLQSLARTAEASPQAAERLALPLAAALPDDAELHEVDDAFFDGDRSATGGTALARALFTELHASGKHDAAQGFADNEHGEDLQEIVAAQVLSAVDAGTAPEQVARDFGPFLTSEIARSVRDHDDQGSTLMATALTELAGRAAPELRGQLASDLAAALPDQADLLALDDVLHGRVQGQNAFSPGNALDFSVDLMNALSSAGKLEAAGGLTTVVHDGIGALRTEFESAQNEVDDLNGELNRLVGENQGILTPQQLQAAVNGFHDEHREAYERLERAGAAFSGQLDAIGAVADRDSPLSRLPGSQLDGLREEADRALVNVFPRLAGTRAGASAIGAANVAAGRGEHTILDVVTHLDLSDERVRELASDETEEALGLRDGATFGQQVSQAIFRGAASQLAGHPEAAQQVIDGLLHQAGTFGLSRSELSHLLDDARAVTSGATAELREAAADRLREQSAELEFLGPETAAGQAFRGFTTVLGALGTAQGLAHFGEASTRERIATLASALDTGVGAFELVAGITEQTSLLEAASGATGALTGVTGGLTAVLEGISAVDSFRHGDFVSGTGHSATALGSAVLGLAAASEVVPVAGQVAGAVLVAVGVGLTQFARVGAANAQEGPTRDFLSDAGLSDKLAEELANHTGNGGAAGPGLAAVAQAAHLTPGQLTAHLEQLPESTLQFLVESGVHSIPVDEQGVPDEAQVRAVARFFEETGLLPPEARVD
ncbi:MAG: hypothetical protein K1X89_16010 [Myxococcaceae bacterium]|nr:hypothetical protein [Myxococcaceae bacterium]